MAAEGLTTTGPLLLALGALAFGFGSAFVPVLNAEAFVLAAVAARPGSWVVTVAAVSVGQSAGKVVFFQVARSRSRIPGLRGRGRPARHRGRHRRASAWRARLASASQRMLPYLDRPLSGGGVVLVSSFAGIPPLAVVAVVAGLRRLSVGVFSAAVLAGRLGRFAVLAWPVVVVARGR